MSSDTFIKNLDALTIFTWSPWFPQDAQGNRLVRMVHIIATCALGLLTLGTLHIGTLLWMDARVWQENTPSRIKEIFFSLFPDMKQLHNRQHALSAQDLLTQLESLRTKQERVLEANRQTSQDITLQNSLQALQTEVAALSQQVKAAEGHIQQHADVLKQMRNEEAELQRLLGERGKWISKLENPLYSSCTSPEFPLESVHIERMQRAVYEVQRLWETIPQGKWTDELRNLCLTALDPRHATAIETLCKQFPSIDFFTYVAPCYQALKTEDFYRFWNSLKAAGCTSLEHAYTAKSDSIAMFGFWKDPQCFIWVGEKDGLPRIHYSWKKVSEETPFRTFSVSLPNVDHALDATLKVYLSHDSQDQCMPKDVDILERALLPILEHRDAHYCCPEATCRVVPYTFETAEFDHHVWKRHINLYVSKEMASLAPMWCLEQFLEGLKQVQLRGPNIKILSIQDGREQALQSKDEICIWIKTLLDRIISYNPTMKVVDTLKKFGARTGVRNTILSFYSPSPLAREGDKYTLRAVRKLDDEGVRLCKILGGLIGLSAYNAGWGGRGSGLTLSSLFSKKILAGLIANHFHSWNCPCRAAFPCPHEPFFLPYEQVSQETRHVWAISIAWMDDVLQSELQLQKMPWLLILNSLKQFQIEEHMPSVIACLLQNKESAQKEAWWQAIYNSILKDVPDVDKDNDAAVVQNWTDQRPYKRAECAALIADQINQDPCAKKFIESLPWGDPAIARDLAENWRKHSEALERLVNVLESAREPSLPSLVGTSIEQLHDPVYHRRFLNQIGLMFEKRYADLLPAIYAMAQGAQESYKPIKEAREQTRDIGAHSAITGYFFNGEARYNWIKDAVEETMKVWPSRW